MEYEMQIIQIFLTLLIALGLSIPANAKSFQGKFVTGQAYTGVYTVNDAQNSDGMSIERVNVTVHLNNETSALSYSYDADAPPSVQANPLGLLTIVVNSGGMEGQVTYNYVLPYKGKLSSIGSIETPLHLGKVDSIRIQRSDLIPMSEVNGLVLKVINLNSSGFKLKDNAYLSAVLLILGGGRYQNSSKNPSISQLMENKEIGEDPILFKKLVSTLRSSEISGNSHDSQLAVKCIISEKAYLLGSPKSTDSGKAYLIKGDKVLLVQESQDKAYWKIIYVTAKGKRVERWIDCRSLNYCD